MAENEWAAWAEEAAASASAEAEHQDQMDAQQEADYQAHLDAQQEVEAALAAAAAQPEPEEVPEPEAPKGPSVLDANRAFILRKAISDRVAAQVKGEREVVLQRILDGMEATGANRLAVTLPDGTPVATISLVQPAEKIQVDHGRLIKWAQENGREDLLETVQHPAQEAWEEVVAKPQAEAAITEGAPWSEGHPVVEGEVLDFITRETPPYSSFRVAYSKPKTGPKGDDRIIQAWLDGDLPQLDLGPDLPQLEG